MTLAPERQQVTLLLDVVQRLGIVEGQNTLIIQDQGRAADGRQRIYEAVTEVNDRIDGVNLKLEKIDSLEKEIVELKKHAADYVQFRHRLKGALWVIGSLGGTAMLLMGAVIKDLWSMWRGQ